VSEAVPTKIDIEDIPVDEQTDSFRQVRLIERSNTRSEVVLGLQWYTPGGEAVSWTADAESHEVFFVTEGKVEVSWQGPDDGSSQLAAGDAFFLPPGRTYSVKAAGAHPAALVWALTPAPA
jgi:quercetin dioxygenase-like cupin family protein